MKIWDERNIKKDICKFTKTRSFLNQIQKNKKGFPNPVLLV